MDKNDGAHAKYYLEDGLHPNKQGHLLMADKVVDFLRDQFQFNYK
jgi:lysophospholipase L1-like esterase